MSNPNKGDVSFATAGGEAFTLRYSQDALCQLEEMTGRGFYSISKEMMGWSADPETMRLSTIRALFWAGLRDHHPGISVKEAGELITELGGMNGAMELIGEGLKRAFADEETKDARPPTLDLRPQGNGTGKAP